MSLRNIFPRNLQSLDASMIQPIENGKTGIEILCLLQYLAIFINILSTRALRMILALVHTFRDYPKHLALNQSFELSEIRAEIKGQGESAKDTINVFDQLELFEDNKILQR